MILNLFLNTFAYRQAEIIRLEEMIKGFSLTLHCQLVLIKKRSVNSFFKICESVS